MVRAKDVLEGNLLMYFDILKLIICILNIIIHIKEIKINVEYLKDEDYNFKNLVIQMDFMKKSIIK